MRATAQQMALIDQAAEAVGKTRTEFILYAAGRCAEETVLGHKVFPLDVEEFTALQKLLDEPAKPHEGCATC